MRIDDIYLHASHSYTCRVSTIILFIKYTWIDPSPPVAIAVKQCPILELSTGAANIVQALLISVSLKESIDQLDKIARQDLL